METKPRSGKTEVKKESIRGPSEPADLSTDQRSGRKLMIEGYPVEGLSIAGHETCVILPSLKLAFDIGRCPQRAISQDFLFISHAHMDHIVSSFLSFFLKVSSLREITRWDSYEEKLSQSHVMSAFALCTGQLMQSYMMGILLKNTLALHSAVFVYSWFVKYCWVILTRMKWCLQYRKVIGMVDVEKSYGEFCSCWHSIDFPICHLLNIP